MEFQLNEEQLQEIFNFYQQPGPIASPVRTSDYQVESIRPRKIKRKRTSYSMEQKQRLEEEYSKREGFIGRAERCILARQIDVPEQKVKIWFQNKRMQAKRKAQNSPYQRSPNTIGVTEPTVFSFDVSETSLYFDQENRIPESPSWDSDQILSPISSVSDEEISFNFELAEDFIQNDLMRGFANQSLNFHQQLPQFDVLETLGISHFEEALQINDTFLT